MQLSLRRPSPHTAAFLLFLFLYALALVDIRHVSWRDPGSVFFDPARAFERQYSLVREAQATSFIKSAGENADVGLTVPKAGPNPEICAGITTLQREGARYFQRAVGSLLAGLTDAERNDLWLVPFIVNLDPEEHSAYNESWLPQVTDQVLTYADATSEVRAKVQAFDDVKKKALFDYAYLLKTCYAKGMPWVVMLEDDTIAADGWYLRTKVALNELAGRRDFHSILYLRLFYNERLLGWNSEEWLSYVFRSLLVEVAVAGVLFAALRYIPNSSPILTPRTCITLIIICTPMCIALFFSAGRLTVSPPPRGLHRMEKYGCCSQAFVFPREQIPELVSWYEVQLANGGYVDVLTEYYAKMEGLKRWAITPSVFNHVGSKSSKSQFVSRWGRSNTENIWNFSFERFREGELEGLHVG